MEGRSLTPSQLWFSTLIGSPMGKTPIGSLLSVFFLHCSKIHVAYLGWVYGLGYHKSTKGGGGSRGGSVCVSESERERQTKKWIEKRELY